MNKVETTRDLLLTHGRRLFWTKGYSNVSVREIAGAANVDVALIARYFGSKRGLFEATLDTLETLDCTAFETPEALVDTLVDLFARAPRDGTGVSPISLMVNNAGDEDVGPLVIDAQRRKWQDPLEKVIGDRERAALFVAAMLGFSLAEKSLHLEAIGTPGSPDYAAQFRHILTSALRYDG